MKKQKRILLQMLIFLIIGLSGCKVFATDNIDVVEYSEDYKKYLELSAEEQKKVIEPSMYDIPKTTRKVTNPLKLTKMLSASVATSYSLRNVIPDNMVIKNQQNTKTSWAFAGIGILESTLAVMDYKNGKSPIIYDFSERHMEYATTNTFKDGTNEKGFNRKVNSGGTNNVVEAYLTNGIGAISEKEMPFENNTDLIELNKIQNVNIVTQVDDIVRFPSYESTEDTTQIKQQVKEHIKNYGGIYATIYLPTNLINSDCYNNKTGAIYCNDTTTYKSNHAVMIIGWDDNYSKDNFSESKKPKNNGAWIIKNSRGTEKRYNLAEMKETIFKKLPNKCAENGWTSANLIPDNEAKKIFQDDGYTIKNNEAVMNVGDNGFMYVSYEDVYIYKGLMGITDAKIGVNYDNIYQYNKTGMAIIRLKGGNKARFATVFDKKNKGTEYLTQVAINVPETYTCKVYVNPNGSGKEEEDFQQVQLKTGETETFEAGYHTIEFLNPIEITGDSFVVLIEVEGTREDMVYAWFEYNYGEYHPEPENASSPLHKWDNVTTAEGRCFVAYGEDITNWEDTSKEHERDETKPNYNTTVKAFTVSKLSDPILEGIEITTPPTKTSYDVGENFDKTGMIVKAKYSDGTSKEITDYIIKDGTNLIEGKTGVTIEYQGKTAMQKITVVRKDETATVASISVKAMPTKTQYIQNKEELDLTGGVIEVTYSDGSKVDVAMTSNDIIASGFNNKIIGKNIITIMYKEKTVQFEVEIKKEDNENVKKPQNSNFDTMQGNVTRMKAYYFTDATKKEYTVISVDVNDITFANGNDKMEYYYYLSSNPQENNIKDWVKIDNFNKNNNKLSFEINTSDNSNYDEISNSDTLYLYIKEVATLNNVQQEKITSSLKLEVENINVEEYIDGKKKSEVDSGTIVNPTPANKPNDASSDIIDDTTASEIIPKAGKGMLIIGIILILIVIGRITYLKYKDIQIK